MKEYLAEHSSRELVIHVYRGAPSLGAVKKMRPGDWGSFFRFTGHLNQCISEESLRKALSAVPVLDRFPDSSESDAKQRKVRPNEIDPELSKSIPWWHNLPTAPSQAK